VRVDDILIHPRDRDLIVGTHGRSIYIADDITPLEQMKTTSRFRGQQCGVEYAEGFVQCLTWLRGTTRRLLP